MCNNRRVPDAFVTLISVQPAVAVLAPPVKRQKAEPQATGAMRGGLYLTKRDTQVVIGKTDPPGAK